MITIGFDKQCITPKLPIPLRGYAGVRIAQKVHDDLYTRCLALEKNGIRYLFVQCDLIGVDDSVLNAVHEKISDLDIKKEHLTIVATHTHAGPGGTVDTSKEPFANLQSIFGEPNPEYLDFLAEQVALAARNAFADLKPCKLTIARGTIEHVGTERHDPSLAGDNSLLIFQFTRTDEKTLLLYNYACHPTVTGPGNIMITADFPYAVERDLNYDVVMFVNSNAGDISTRFTRKDSSFEQVEIYKEYIVASIQEALKSPVYQGDFDDFSMKRYPITLPLKKVRPVKVEKDALEKYEAGLAEAISLQKDALTLRLLSTYVEGAKIAVGLAETLQGLENISAHFTVITLQGIQIAVVPGELFSTLGVPLKKEGIEIFGYGNGYYLYIADKKSYDQMVYEAMSSLFEKGVGELLVNEIRKSIKDCQ